MTKCVGAFLRPCDNVTEAILCRACYEFVDKVLYDRHRRDNRAANETRTVYRRKAKAVA